MRFTLEDFIRESNRIEGILRDPTEQEIEVHDWFSGLTKPSVEDVEAFVKIVQPVIQTPTPGKPIENRIRTESWMNVRVGNHVAPRGGPEIRTRLEKILKPYPSPQNAYRQHVAYETLHPFLDGNGRSGRVVWLNAMGGIERVPIGFLHSWYYGSLANSSERRHVRTERT